MKHPVPNLRNKFLISKNRINLRTVKTTSTPDQRDRDRYTGLSETVPVGAMCLCIQDFSEKSGRMAGIIYLLYGEMTYEAHASDFEVAEPSSRFAGKSFCFTGALQHTRDYYKALVELHDGEFAKTVTQTLTYLVQSDAKMNTTKAVKAKRYGTQVLDEATLLAMIRAPLPVTP